MDRLYQKNRLLIMINMVIVFGWLLSFPYHGPVLDVMIKRTGHLGMNASMVTVFFVAIGLFIGSFISKNRDTSKWIIVSCTGLTLFLSLLTLFIKIEIWIMIIPFEAFLAGVVIPVHGRLIKAFIEKEYWHRTIANLVIGGNIVLVLAHILTTTMNPILSYIFIEILLAIAFMASIKIDLKDEDVISSEVTTRTGHSLDHASDTNVDQKLTGRGTHAYIFLKNYWMLLMFIFIVSINAGLMFTVIYPYFSRFELLMSIYTNLPYILAIYIISRVIKRNKYYLLYIGLAAWGMTFILFALLEAGVISFFVIFTVMLTAAGIFDMFWASIMVDNFEHISNPSLLYGCGLSINVLGVWAGSIAGNVMQKIGIDKYTIALIGLFIVMLLVLILVPLNNYLSNQLDYNDFIIRLNDLHKKDLKDYLSEVETCLTKREFEVFTLLIAGKTDTLISEELFISMHTIKTHNRSIYKKLKVSNRVELIEKIMSF